MQPHSLFHPYTSALEHGLDPSRKCLYQRNQDPESQASCLSLNLV